MTLRSQLTDVLKHYRETPNAGTTPHKRYTVEGTADILYTLLLEKSLLGEPVEKFLWDVYRDAYPTLTTPEETLLAAIAKAP